MIEKAGAASGHIDEQSIEDRHRAAAAGMLLMILTVGLFVVMDTIAKYLGEYYSVSQVVWARYSFHLGFMLLLIPVIGLRRLLYTRDPLRQVIRAGLLLLTSTVTYIAVRYLPLTDIYAINFTAPLLVTLLSIPMLGERVGLRRFVAVGLGFAGALLVIRPGFETFNIGFLFAGIMALSFALFQIVTRQVSADESPFATLFYAATLGALAGTIAMPFDWQPLRTPMDLGLMAALGLVGASAHLALILALRRAPASLIAPFTYTQLIWATLLGFLVFGDLPDGWTLAGAAIVVSSGLYIYLRERQIARRDHAAATTKQTPTVQQ